MVAKQRWEEYVVVRRFHHKNKHGLTPMRKAVATLALSLAAALAVAPDARATIIGYDAANVSGNTWLYSYTVTNDNADGGAVSVFDILFAADLFANLDLVSLPFGWAGGAFEPGTIDDDGLFIGVTLPFLGFGIDQGETLGGFRVRFDFLGAGTPGAQLFQILDPYTLRVVETGATVRRIAVSEPGVLALLAVAIGAFGIVLPGWRRVAAAR